METLTAIFPNVPPWALRMILGMCNDDAQVATSWVLENDWRELEYTGETTRHTGQELFEEEEDEEEEDEDDEEEEEEEEGNGREEDYYIDRLLPLTKRRKIEHTPKEKMDGKEERYYVCFDEEVVVQKSLIEMLNMALSKLAHGSVMLLNDEVKTMSEEKAGIELKSVVKKENIGYWMYPYSVAELDIIWRSVLHAHLFNHKFGKIIEFHTLSAIGTGVRGFDEVMHCFNSIPPRIDANIPMRNDFFRCCLVLPCSTDKMMQVGQHLHSILKLKDPLYYISPKTEKEESKVATKVEENVEPNTMTDHQKKSSHRLVKMEEGGSKPSTSSILGYLAGPKVSYKLQKSTKVGSELKWEDVK